MRILVTQAGWQAGLGCIQSLGRRGHRIDILDQDPSSPHRESGYVAGIVPSPHPVQDAAYEAHLERLVLSGDYDLVIPITDRDAYLLTRIRQRRPELRNLVLPALASMETAHHKARATQLAQGLGIVVPESWFPADMDAVRSLLPALSYPCVVKLPFGSGGDGVFIVESQAALVDRMRWAFADGQQPFIQRHIVGDQLNVMFMADRGTVVGAFTCAIKRRHYVGGTPPFATSVADSHLMEIGRRLAAALHWHGAMDIDCLRSADGTTYFLESNPRLSGNVIFADKTGIDLPALYIDLLRGTAAPPASFDIPADRTFCALSDSEVRWVLKNPRRHLAEALGMHLSWRSCTNIFWTDWPLLRAQWRHIRQLIRTSGHAPTRRATTPLHRPA